MLGRAVAVYCSLYRITPLAHTSSTYDLVLEVVKENCMTADVCNMVPDFTEIGCVYH